MSDFTFPSEIKRLSIFAACVFGASFSLTAASLAQDSSFCGTYSIQRGDTLSRLADRAFGSATRFMQFYNDPRNNASLGTNPNRISVGATLYLRPCSSAEGDGPNLGEDEDFEPTDPFAGTIDIVTGTDFAPFTHEDLEAGGMLTAVVKEAFSKSGLNQSAKIVFINDWGAHLSTLLPDHKYQFTFPWYRPDCSDPSALSDQMRPRCDLIWSDPLFSVIIGFYALSTTADVPNDFDGFRGKNLCRPDGYFTFDLEENGLIPGDTIKLFQPSEVADCFDMLKDGEVDFVTINRFTAEKAIASAGLDGLIIPISTVVTSQDLHLVGHQSNPDSVRLIRAFNKGLEVLRAERRLSRITRFFMDKHQRELEQLRSQ